MGERVCLRCDWTGETDAAACPRCEASLYRLPESTEPREVTPIPRPQPQSESDPPSSSPVEVPQEDDSVPPAVPVTASRRRAVIAGALTVAAVWIVATGGWFNRTRTPAVPGGAETGPAKAGCPGCQAGPREAVGVVPETDYLLDLDTGVMTPLPEAIVESLGGGERQYAVSPDGSRLAYVGTRDDHPGLGPLPGHERDDQIFIAGIDGTGVRQVQYVRQVTHAPNGAGSPAWSPDGTRIAYEAIDSGHLLGLYLLDVASGESTQITGVNVDYRRCQVGLDPLCSEGDRFFVPVQPKEPQFTPNGQSLIYTGSSDGHLVIWTAPVAGGESTLLIGPDWNLRKAENGSLSPDGSLVTFLGRQMGGPGGRWVADTDGTDRSLLPNVYGIPCRSTPTGTWSPDGGRIVCSEASKIIVVDIATGTATPIATGRGAIWLDDRTLLVSV
jgi:WD40-like Beta Propeller Repeat